MDHFAGLVRDFSTRAMRASIPDIQFCILLIKDILVSQKDFGSGSTKKRCFGQSLFGLANDVNTIFHWRIITMGQEYPSKCIG
jgi:hypothetical protein